MMKTWILAACSAVFATPSVAEISVRFFESAPKDRFEIEYNGACDLTDVELEIDLGSSAAGLILDTTETGAGVNVYQPLEVVTGQALLNKAPGANDGDTKVSLSAASLSSGDRIVFTTDVDDTQGTSPTMISGGEITGARVSLRTSKANVTGVFGADGAVQLAINGCSV